MRVLFACFAAKSHLYEMVPLAWAMHTAGHEVRVASQPDLADIITRGGLPAVPVGEVLDLDRRMREDTSWRDDESIADIDLAENRPEKLTWDYVYRVFDWHREVVFESLASQAVLSDAVEFARDWRPDLVIWDHMSFFGPVAARASGAAHARFLLGQDFIGRMRGHFLRLMREQPGPCADPMAEWLAPVVRRFGGEFGEDLVLGHWSIDCTLPWLRLPLDLDHVPLRFVPYHGPVAVPEWLPEHPARPRVCLTAGLGGREILGEDWIPFSTVFEAVADLDVDVVATLSAAQLEGVTAIPDNVRLFDFFPLNTLVPSCSAVIHHGGGGAFGTALTHGVPQLVVPSQMWWDAMTKAEDLAARGAALVLMPEELTAETVRASLVRLIEEPSFRVNAAEVRSRFLATPSPNAVVPRLEELTRAFAARGEVTSPSHCLP
jgi:glycosyltransferase (activator-dependent family)